MGVDVAGMGEDETVLVSVAKTDNDKLLMYDMKILMKSPVPSTARRILYEDEREDYMKIYIDDGGLGVGVFQLLLEHYQTSRKVVAINNSHRSLDSEDKQRKRILKEDLYTNLKSLMEQGRIKLWKNDKLRMSLRSIQYHHKNGRMLISGNYSHIVEALNRAAWSEKDKSLNIFIY
jgi:hypothetical protein